MAEIVQNIIQNSVGGMVAGAVTTIGGYAGDAVGGIGNMIESAGRSVGEGINRTISGVGSAINSYGDAARKSTATSTASYSTSQRTAVKKSVTQSKEQKGTPRREPQKALPSTKPMKALPAPPRMVRSKSADTVTSKASTAVSRASTVKPKPYDPTHSSYKPTGTSYRAPGGTPANQRKPEPKRTLQADGKVRVSAESRPSIKPVSAAPKPFTPPSQAPKPRLTETNLKSVSGSGIAHIPGYAPSATGASVKSSATLKAPSRAPREKAKSTVQPRAASVAGTIDRQFF